MAVIVIPARWGSTRFPGKALADLAGKPLIQHVWEQCRRAKRPRRVIVATDDMRIAEVVFQFGAEVALTRRGHPSGTDRVAEVAANLRGERVIVNVQGDEPFIEPQLIDRLVAVFDTPRAPEMATAASPLARQGESDDPNVVKAVVASDGRALYFSRSPVPFDRGGTGRVRRLRHHGIYAFRRDFLLRLVKLPPSPLERAEQLEQLRALEHGARIQVLVTRSSAFGVDTPRQALEAARRLKG